MTSCVKETKRKKKLFVCEQDDDDKASGGVSGVSFASSYVLDGRSGVVFLESAEVTPG